MTPVRTHRVKSRHSNRSLDATILSAGDDLLILITGGTQPHIGSVVLARPQAQNQVLVEALTIPPHKEEKPARHIAQRIAESCRRTVVVSLGIHEDNLDSEGIQDYLDLSSRLAEELASLCSN